MEKQVKEIEPRPLSEREASWIRDILRVNDEWRNADISTTRVIAEGPCDEGICLRLKAPAPENPGSDSDAGSVGNLWIQVDDGSTINVQLSQYEGRLQEIYVLFVDPKHPERKLPTSWKEVSRQAANL
ncbi:MAG TPA: hypothetical protein VHV32_10015 [Candidatus Angelobacter sp.]|jgi:hypothetical protein|nr:hypothetical protein [Candidatus Angelobacter sp.]